MEKQGMRDVNRASLFIASSYIVKNFKHLNHVSSENVVAAEKHF